MTTYPPTSSGAPPVNDALLHKAGPAHRADCRMRDGPVRPRTVANGCLRAAVDRWSARVEGARVRRTIRVQALAPGMVSVRLSGDPRAFASVGLRAAFGPHGGEDDSGASGGTRHLNWIAVDLARYRGGVLAGAGLLDPFDEPARTAVRLNGGYFNYLRRACPLQPEHIPIGPVALAGRRRMPSLAVPARYGPDYRSVCFPDGSCLTSAPMLSESGVAVFAAKAAGNPDYRLPAGFSFDGGGQVPPGCLWHAHDPNPRAGISYPPDMRKGIARLVAAPMPSRSLLAGGWSLSDFSHAMARLDRLNTPANSSLNLDGGESLALRAWVDGNKALEVCQASTPRWVANLIEFTS